MQVHSQHRLAHHEQRPAPYTGLFHEWLGVTPLSMQFLMDQHRNPGFWRQAIPGEWMFEGPSTHAPSAAAPSPVKYPFVANSTLEQAEIARYVVVGKGYP